MNATLPLRIPDVIVVFCLCIQDQIQPKGSPPVNELDMEFTLLAEARSHPNLMDTGDVKEGQLSADVTDFLSGDNFPASHAFGASVDDLLRL